VARRRRSYRRFALLFICVVVAVLVFPRGGDRLWRAVVQVESSGNPKARNAASDAVGIAQITKGLVDDCNRILGKRRFTYDDRWDPAKSRRMFDVYLGYWGKQYERQTGKRCTDEMRARMWNGGPRGWELRSTEEYWRRVKQHY